MKQFYRITEGRLAEAENCASASVVVYLQPDEAERKILVDDLQVDEHTLSSALDPDELARLESEPEHLAVIFKRPKSAVGGPHFELGIGSIGVFLSRERMVVVLADDIPFLEGMLNVRVSGLPSLFLRLIYRSIAHFLEHLKVIQKMSDELQDQINQAMENRYLIQLFELQKSLVYYVSAVNSNEALIERLKPAAAKSGWAPADLELLDDVQIESRQCARQAEVLSNILSGLMDARVSIVSNNLNVLMKLLNFITIGIMVPTLVVSAFSMNVKIPIADNPNAFWLIMGLALTSVLGLVAYLRLKKW